MTLLFPFVLHGTMICCKILHCSIFSKSPGVSCLCSYQSPFQPSLRSPFKGHIVTVKSCVSHCIPHLQSEGSEMVLRSSNNSLCLCGKCPAPKCGKYSSPKPCLLSWKCSFSFHPKHISPKGSDLIRGQERDMLPPPIIFVSSSQVARHKIPSDFL